MAEHPTYMTGTIPGVITVVLGIVAKITVSGLASFITIAVGLYTLFINWPKFKKRAIEVYKKYKVKKDVGQNK